MEPRMLLDVERSVRFGLIGHVRSMYAKDAMYALSEVGDLRECDTLRDLEEHISRQSLLSLPDVLLVEIDDDGKCFGLVEKLKNNILLKGIIIVLLADHQNDQWRERAKHIGVHDYYEAPYAPEDIMERISFLVKFKLIKPTLTGLLEKDIPHYKIPFVKRAFDVLFSLVLLTLLAPLLLVVALIIRLESKGPVIYRSKRVGTGFRVFDFYKFRSMYSDADKRLAEMATMNQYANGDTGGSAVFFKIKDDPRITRFGRFIRKTSIDELPQFVNILIGDMSVVGNRPLPFYEAEKLTSDEWTWRFMAPAGLTGLWQIRCRGKETISERQRKKLDNFYAKKHSFLFDLQILAKTPFVFLQKTNV